MAFVSAIDNNTSSAGESLDVEYNLGDINENNNSLENQEIYVNPLGSDDANGTFQNPVSSIHRAVDMAGNNSKIILMDGEYKGIDNTLILINKKLYDHRKEIEYRLTSLAFGIYAGWLTIASFVNMLAFLISIN